MLLAELICSTVRLLLCIVIILLLTKLVNTTDN